MATKTLAIKYRPKTWGDVTEQVAAVQILKQQLDSDEIKNAYLFCGPAGTGKTTCARIFANDINKGKGNPIELDAASNNGVDDVRNIIQQAKTKSIGSEYKIFIIDECHSISNTGWQAFLKLIEEPPAKSIFIFCTTDPQKIPKTILSRVQRYDFRRISQNGIVNRLYHILGEEKINTADRDAIEYIAKISEGGMRDAISLMDKCLSYSTELSVNNVLKALGTVDNTAMQQLTFCVCSNDTQKDTKDILEIVENIHAAGKDLKTFLRQYIQFLLDVSKYGLGCDWSYLSLPKTAECEQWLNQLTDPQYEVILKLLSSMVKLNSEIKYSAVPKTDIQTALLLFVQEGRQNDGVS